MYDVRKSIRVENLHLPLSENEREEIINKLNQHEIEIVFFETRDLPRASVFEAITIFFNWYCCLVQFYWISLYIVFAIIGIFEIV